MQGSFNGIMLMDLNYHHPTERFFHKALNRFICTLLQKKFSKLQEIIYLNKKQME